MRAGRMLKVLQPRLMVKNLPASSGDARDPGSIPGSGRSPEGGNDSPLQYSCLGNPMDRGAWWATVHGGHIESDTTEHLSTTGQQPHPKKNSGRT